MLQATAAVNRQWYGFSPDVIWH